MFKNFLKSLAAPLREPASPGSSISVLIVAMIMACGALIFGLHVAHYPITEPFDPSALSLPDGTQLAALLQTLAWLALINLSAWSLGSLAESRFRLPPEAPSGE